MRKKAFGESNKSMFDKVIEWVRIKRVLSLVGTAKKIVDLGCGYKAEMLTRMLSQQTQGLGIDLSVDQSLTNDKLQLVEGRVDDPLPLPSNTYQLVTALAIIEHVEMPDLMLEESYRILKRGGRMIVTTPSLLGKWPLEIMSALKIISREEIADHKRYYTRGTLTEAMRRAGFSHVSVKHFGIMWLNLIAEGRK